jgi:HSP20 family protein
MSVDRFDPFRDVMTIREAMDRWLQQSISGTGQFLSNLRPDAIPIDLIEHDGDFELRASVPGVRPDDLEVTVQGERVTIRAEVRSDDERRGDTWLVREQRFGTMQRTITLPVAVSSDNAQARIEHGILWLVLPKAQGAPMRRIAVSTGSGSGAGTRPAAAGSSTSAADASDLPSGSGVSSAGSGSGIQASGHGSRNATAEGHKVTEESQESFPASDPPPWTPERA